MSDFLDGNTSHSSDCKEFEVQLIPFNDGQKPGGTNVETKLALYPHKAQSNFFMIFDQLLPEEWCTRAYEYALKKGNPWGSYITTDEASSATVVEDAENLWGEGKFEKAIALKAVRALVIERAGSMISNDLPFIHGKASCSDLLVLFNCIIIRDGSLVFDIQRKG